MKRLWQFLCADVRHPGCQGEFKAALQASKIGYGKAVAHLSIALAESFALNEVRV